MDVETGELSINYGDISTLTCYEGYYFRHEEFSPETATQEIEVECQFDGEWSFRTTPQCYSNY